MAKPRTLEQGRRVPGSRFDQHGGFRMHRPGRRQSLLLHVFARLVAASLAAIGALVLMGPGLALTASDAGAAAPAGDVPSLAEIDELRTETSRTFAAGGTVLAVPRGMTGTFEAMKRIGSYDLTVRGRVVNGVPRIGTVFVP